MHPKFATLLLITVASSRPLLAQTSEPPRGASAEHRPTSQVIDEWVSLQERQLTAVAEAMPADKYTFAPTGGEFKGVRTFAQQVKHVAADNYMLGAAILGVDVPAHTGDETGPDSLRTKAAVIGYLRGSYAYFHKAVATIDQTNVVDRDSPISPLHGTATRLGLAIETLMHTYDHYGQMVEYLRMNGIIPPGSRL